MTMVLGIGIMKHIRKLLGFFVKCLPSIFLLLFYNYETFKYFTQYSVKLQHQSLDISNAYEQISDVKN